MHDGLNQCYISRIPSGFYRRAERWSRATLHEERPSASPLLLRGRPCRLRGDRQPDGARSGRRPFNRLFKHPEYHRRGLPLRSSSTDPADGLTLPPPPRAANRRLAEDIRLGPEPPVGHRGRPDLAGPDPQVAWDRLPAPQNLRDGRSGPAMRNNEIIRVATVKTLPTIGR